MVFICVICEICGSGSSFQTRIHCVKRNSRGVFVFGFFVFFKVGELDGKGGKGI